MAHQAVAHVGEAERPRPDVLKMAQECRLGIRAEITKVAAFLCLAEELLRAALIEVGSTHVNRPDEATCVKQREDTILAAASNREATDDAERQSAPPMNRHASIFSGVFAATVCGPEDARPSWSRKFERRA